MKILEASDIHVSFKEEKKSIFDKTKYNEVIKGASFYMNQNEIVGLVGESGCGKSTLAGTVLGLIKPDQGEITHHSDHPQMIFQDPYSSLNPCKTVQFILEEPLRNLTDIKADDRKKKAIWMLEEVGLDESYLSRLPSELSGGQRQRVAIAQSLMLGSKLIIADEPVSALDVTIQAQVLKLIKDLKNKYELSMLFISHDLRVVYQLCDRVMIMKNGIIIEQGNRDEIYRSPKHEYTRQLLKSAGII